MSPAIHREVVKKFTKAHILVIGDVMLDMYVSGVSERLSVEAPVPIVRETERRFVLGGAANVASNVASLGGQVSLVGIVGDDSAGQAIRELTGKAGITSHFVLDPSRPTTEKTRIIVAHHQVVRVDRESDASLSPDIEERVIAEIKNAVSADVVIFSDYSKGVVTEAVLRATKERFGAGKIIADFKPVHGHLYRGVGVILPNIKEAHGLTGIEATTEALADDALRRLSADFGAAVVLKRSEHGLSLLDPKTNGVRHIPTRARDVFDVTGAGDTVIGAFGLALATGANLFEAAEIANHAAGIVVELEGTATPSAQELLGRL